MDKIKELEAKVILLENELISYRNKGIESRLRRAEIAARTGNWELHLDTGKINGSEGALLLYGLTDPEMKYEEVKMIPLQEYRSLLDTSLKQLIDENIPYDIEFKIKNAQSGNILDIHSTAEYDEKSRTVFGVIHDITQHKASEEQIRKKSQELQVLLEITMEFLEKADNTTVLNNILIGTKRLVGLETGAVYSINDNILILESTIPPLPDNFPAEFRRAELKNHPHIAQAIQKRKPVIIPDVRTVTLTPHENLIVSERDMRTLMFIPLVASGQSYGVIVLGTLGRLHIFEEHEISLCRTISNIASLALENSILISNLKSARDLAQQSDRLKTAFLHNISHEIRTPLNAIIGFSGFLEQPDLSAADKRKFIEIIQQSNNQLLNIINDIFNVSHIEAGQVLLKETETDLVAILRNLYNQFTFETSEKGLDLKLELGNLPEKEFRIIADEGKLIQVLTNIISNAIKFTSNGKVVFGCERNNDILSFFVEDTGIGIPAGEQSKIFERFYQVDKSGTRVYPGTGLGLSISDAYIRLMGGKISLVSAPGEGSRFSFNIKFKPAGSSDGLPNYKSSSGSGDKRIKTILIAEDEKSNSVLLEMMLKSLDARILHASHGLEAVEICRNEEKIDLVLMDIKMPVMNGYTATEEIKKFRPDLPVIAQTAYTDQSDRQKAFKSGCVDLLPKPISKTKLLEIVRKYLYR